MARIDSSDKYTAGIEVSNACRMFYVSRLQTAETLKDRLVDRRRAVRAAAAASSPPRHPDRPTAADTPALESAIARLHKELATLIDTDLKVMRQLLMLNDQVEEMKWQRRQQQRQALLSSTCLTPGIDDTDCSDSEPRWSRSGGVPDTPDSWSLMRLDRSSADDIDDDDEEATLKYPTPSALSLLRGAAIHQDDRFSNSGSTDALDGPTQDVFLPVPQTTEGDRDTAVERKANGRTPGDGNEVVMKSKEMHLADRRSSDLEGKPLRSPTKLKEHELHTTNADCLQDFCTYVEMLI